MARAVEALATLCRQDLPDVLMTAQLIREGGALLQQGDDLHGGQVGGADGQRGARPLDTRAPLPPGKEETIIGRTLKEVRPRWDLATLSNPPGPATTEVPCTPGGFP